MKVPPASPPPHRMQGRAPTRRAGRIVAVAVAIWLLASLAAAATVLTMPSQYFDLSHWKLTLPVDGDGGTSGVAAELQPLQLTDYASGWFRMGSSGRTLEFWAPVSGAVTSGSHYPRSELREMRDPGDDNANWTTAGHSALKAKCLVRQVPTSTGKVVVGQIHGFQARPLVKLVYRYSATGRTGSIYALVEVSPDS